MNRSETAINKFKDGFNCAQSVIYSFSDVIPVSKDTALKIATGFGGGMGRKQEVCGAVSGGILVLGLLYGRTEGEEKAKQDLTYSKVQELINSFEALHGTVCCKNLLNGCELLTPQGQEMFKANKLIDKCHGFVKDVVTNLEKIIDS